jgi:hypothetical protein
VFSLGQASNGTVLAGTGHGLYRLQGEVWSRVNDVTPEEIAPEPSAKGKKSASASKRHVSSHVTHSVAARKGGKPFDADVNAIARSGDTLYAATSGGLLRSVTSGESWQLLASMKEHGWDFVAAAKSTVMAATLKTAVFSSDGGRTWTTVRLPETLEQVSAVAVDGSGGLWVGGPQGVYFSVDGGAAWKTLKDLYLREVNSLFYDEPSQRMLITANSKNTNAFAVNLPDRTVHYWNTGWNLRLIRSMGDHLVGATLFDGIVVQPLMIDSSELKKLK